MGSRSRPRSSTRSSSRSTPEPGPGDGNLWLATAHGILAQSGGSIRATSGVDGTTFTVRLPSVGIRARGGAPPDGRAAASRFRMDPWSSTTRTASGISSNEPCERLGYHVMAVPSGEAALDHVRGYFAEPIDLLITDVVLPGMSGPELADGARRLAAGDARPVRFRVRLGRDRVPRPAGPGRQRPGQAVRDATRWFARCGRSSTNGPPRAARRPRTARADRRGATARAPEARRSAPPDPPTRAPDPPQ